MSKLNDLLSNIITKLNSSVKVEPQELTEEQKAQARQNIGVEAVQAQVQSDWNQNDESAPDFIKNRIAYEEVELLFEDEVQFDQGLAYSIAEGIQLEENVIYKIRLADKDYELKCYHEITILSDGVPDSELYYIGNRSFMNNETSTYLNTGEPFLIIQGTITGNRVSIIQTISPQLLTNLKIEKVKGIKKLDPKFYERLAWEESKTLVPESVFSFIEEEIEMETVYMAPILEGQMTAPPLNGEIYQIKIDGQEYVSRCLIIENTMAYFGDLSMVGVPFGDSSLPFGIMMSASGLPLVDGVVGIIITKDFIETRTISIEAKIIKQIDKKFIPGGVSDFEENRSYVTGYIKNRPFYNTTTKLSAAEALANGAYSLYTESLNTENPTQIVKVGEYIPFGRWVQDIIICLLGEEFTVAQDANVFYQEDFYWSVHNIDTTFILAISPEAFKQGSLPIPELKQPGIYLAIGFNPAGFTEVDYIKLPLVRKIDGQVVSIKWNDIEDRPFGVQPDRAITKITRPENSAVDDSVLILNEQELYKADRFSPQLIDVEDLIGATVIMSDETTEKVKESDIVVIEKDGKVIFWTYKNLLFQSEIIVGEEREFTYTYNGTLFTYVNLFSGISSAKPENQPYPVSIYFPEKIKQIDPKFLPPSASIQIITWEADD